MSMELLYFKTPYKIRYVKRESMRILFLADMFESITRKNSPRLYSGTIITSQSKVRNVSLEDRIIIVFGYNPLV